MRRGFWIGGIVALVTAAGGMALSRQAAFGGRPEGARRARMERSPQWKDGRFVNPQPIRSRMWVIVSTWAASEAAGLGAGAGAP